MNEPKLAETPIYEGDAIMGQLSTVTLTWGVQPWRILQDQICQTAGLCDVPPVGTLTATNAMVRFGEQPTVRWRLLLVPNTAGEPPEGRYS